MVEITGMEQNKEKKWKELRTTSDNIKCSNIWIIGVPEEEEKEKGLEKIFEEITVENFSNIGKEITTHVQEVQRVPYSKPTEKHAETHINQTNIN